MKNISRLAIVLSLSFLIAGQARAEEPAQPSGQAVSKGTPLRGMRGKPLNLPDISVIGVFQGYTSDDQEDMERNRFRFEEVELAFQGFLYPDIRADVFLALHRHDATYQAEICEAKVSFLRIAEGLAAQAGKIHINFGKVNKLHTHHRRMIDIPPAVTNYFGAHGLTGQGATASYLFPLPFFVQVEAGAWRIDAGEHSHDGEEEEATFQFSDEVYTARAQVSFEPMDKAELEFGSSLAYGHGSHYAEHRDKSEVVGADMTFRMWPTAYKRLIFRTEWLYMTRRVPPGKLHRHGLYSFLNYRFNKYFDLGARFDYAEDAFPAVTIERAGSGIATYHFTESTAIQAQYKHRRLDPINRTVAEGWVRLVFGIGPHSHELE